MSDVSAVKTDPFCYVLLELTEGGYLMRRVGRYNVHHRESSIDGRYYRKFNTKPEADAACESPDDIVAYVENNKVQDLIFTPEQMERRMTDRLKRWRTCYGGYGIRVAERTNNG